MRVVKLESSWQDEGHPRFDVVLRSTDGTSVGGEGRWHRVEPPPHWVPQLKKGSILLVRWDDELEHALVDWKASEEYLPEAGYR